MTDDHDDAPQGAANEPSVPGAPVPPAAQASAATPAQPSALAKLEGLPARLEKLVEDWWASHFPGSAVARTTEAWNVAHYAKEELKKLLREV